VGKILLTAKYTKFCTKFTKFFLITRFIPAFLLVCVKTNHTCFKFYFFLCFVPSWCACGKIFINHKGHRGMHKVRKVLLITFFYSFFHPCLCLTNHARFIFNFYVYIFKTLYDSSCTLRLLGILCG